MKVFMDNKNSTFPVLFGALLFCIAVSFIIGGEHIVDVTAVPTVHRDVNNYFLACWVDTDGNVWGTFYSFLGKSTDKGKTFVRKDAPGCYLSGRAVFQDSRGYLYWSPWGEGSIRRSIDDGDNWCDVHTWTDATKERGIWGICEDLLGCLYAGMYTTAPTTKFKDDRIFRSTDGGDNWTTVYDGNDRHIHDVACDPYTGYIYATTGDAAKEIHIIRSIDNGDSWEVINSEIRCFAINFLPGMRLFGDDVDGTIYKTTDDITFTAVYSPSDYLSNFATAESGGKVFFGQVSHADGNTPQIVSTVDGDNWEVVHTGTGTNIWDGPSFMSNFGPDGNCYIRMHGNADDNIRLSDSAADEITSDL
jgi:hypothetical protein